MRNEEQYFYERNGCPFCGIKRTTVLCRVFYHETAEANKDLPNLEGQLYHCHECGIAYSSHGCVLDSYPQFYLKSFRNLSFLNESLIQKLRKHYLKGILKNFYKSWSWSRLLNSLSFNILQPPPLLRKPKGLNILDVGCGFGEFLWIYKQLGNKVTGTEIIPELVNYIEKQNMECHLGAVEETPLNHRKFDVIILRAVFYRTQDPARTLRHVKGLLSADGEIALIDPSPSPEGVGYFFKKQFPQGHFYIMDVERYLSMLFERFGFSYQYTKQIYGRPASALKTIRTYENIMGAIELIYANILRNKPYVLSYNLSVKAD